MLFGAIALAFAVPAFADVQIGQSLDAHPTGKVEIDINSGSVQVIGWDQDTVEVKGTLGDRVQELEFRRGDRKVWVKVHAPKQGAGCEAHILVYLPRNCDASVEAVDGPITISGVRGALDLATLAGDLSVTGPCGRVRAQTVDGDVMIEAPQSIVAITAVEGTVSVTNAHGQSAIELETSSGDVVLTGDAFRDVSVRTVSGSVNFAGDLTPYGKLRIDSHDGAIDATLPSTLAAEFDIRSHVGIVENAFDPDPSQDADPGPGTDRDFVVGSAAVQTKINIDTFKGPIRLFKTPLAGE